MGESAHSFRRYGKFLSVKYIASILFFNTNSSSSSALFNTSCDTISFDKTSPIPGILAKFFCFSLKTASSLPTYAIRFLAKLFPMPFISVMAILYFILSSIIKL